jgi:cytoskeletal protein CcmA (bactofilin family)
VKYDYSLLLVPQREDEVTSFDWERLSSARLTGGKSSFSVIDESTGIHGKLVARNTFIHGEIEGLVFAEHVTVEKTGSVSGVIFCKSLTVYGTVRANIICDSIFVRGDGSLIATLKYRTLKFEAGANVSGNFERRICIDGRVTVPAQNDLRTSPFDRQTIQRSRF